MTAASSALEKGTVVSLRDDPNKKGMLTGKIRELAGEDYYQVFFGETGGQSSSWHPEYELVTADADTDDPLELLKLGRFGNPKDLQRTLTHIHLNGRLADVFYSMDATGTDFLAYQYKPVVAFLESPSNGLLIADEVGLGKTIEAGLIWTELRARFDARRLLVVCPAMLQEKWQLELDTRFGVDAKIVNASELKKELAKPKNTTRPGRGLICSIQGVRPPKHSSHEEQSAGVSAKEELEIFLERQADEEAVIDLTIIDEAHHLRNPGTSSARLGLLLRDASEHLVLLSATPINLKEADLFNLLRLVDPDNFSQEDNFSRVLEANQPLLNARNQILNPDTKSKLVIDSLVEARCHDLLANNRQLDSLITSPATIERANTPAKRVRVAEQIERINLLRHAVSRTRKIDVQQYRVVREPVTEFIALTPYEREFYDTVTHGIRSYALDHGGFAGFLLAMPQRQVSSCMFAAAKAWLQRSSDSISIDPVTQEIIYEAFGHDDLTTNHAAEKNEAPLIDHLKKQILPAIDLDKLRENDSKYERFRSLLSDYLQENPKEKVIVFSFFRGTLDYLGERLAEDGVTSTILKGGMTVPKQSVIDNFREAPDVRVLLSTEVASEGVDLQFCRILFNYDLPWNPMKIEQRIGRLDRIGQRAKKIVIGNFCYKDTIDERIFERLLLRLNIFKKALGGLDAILGEEIGKLTKALLGNHLTPKQEEQQIEQGVIAIETEILTRQRLEENAAQLMAHSSYILQKIQSAHEQKRSVTSNDLVLYATDYLQNQTSGNKFHKISSTEEVFDITLSPELAVCLDELIQRKSLAGLTRLSAGEEVRCEFSNKVKHRAGRVELINQHHPLIQLIRLNMDEKIAYARLVAIRLDQKHTTLERGRYCFAGQLWHFQGLRDEEELQFRMDSISNQKQGIDPTKANATIQVARQLGEAWLEAASSVATDAGERAMKKCMVILERDFQAGRLEKLDENADRVTFQIASAERSMTRQIGSVEKAIATLQERQNVRMIRLHEKRIAKLKTRFELQFQKLGQKIQGFRAYREEVVCGVLEIY